MKAVSIGILTFLLNGFCFGLTVKVDGWAVTNYYSDLEVPSSGQNAVQLDIVLVFDESVARNVEAIELRGKSGSLHVTGVAKDLRIDSGTQVTVRFNKWNVYSEETRYLVPAGLCNLFVSLNDGRNTSCAVSLSSPGAPKHFGSSFVNDRTVQTKTGSDPIRVLAQPRLLRASQDGTLLKIEFSIADSRVFSGVLQLYDQQGVSIGTSEAFVDYKTGKVAEFLNKGKALNVDGTANVLDVTGTDVSLRPNRSFAEAKQVLLVVTDGRQFFGSDVPTWDFMAAVRTGIVKD